jgi:two-component system, OmpR family, sensor kinase
MASWIRGRLSPTSLRTRLVLGLLALAAVGLLVLDVVSYTALRSYLMDRVDQQVQSAPVAVGRTIVAGKVSRHARTGVPGGLPVPPLIAGAGPDLEAPPGASGEFVGPDGKVIGRTPAFGGARPEFPANPPVSASTDRPQLFTVPSSDPSSPGYRAVAIGVPGGYHLLAAVSLGDVDQTLSHLRTIELIVTAAVLAALAALAWWVIRIGLTPLRRMELTANAIAAGDLSARVESTDERTEVGRLGVALNSMLAQIERAFAEREASEERLRHFLADVSHELRTPLSSIRGYAEIFRTGAARDPDELGKAMRRIEDEAERMGVLVGDLLLLARLDETRKPVQEPVDLKALAGEVCDDARAQAPDRTIDLDANGPVDVQGDPEQLRQVIANLLRNALLHTPSGTPIGVSVRGEDGTATLVVRDHGPGLEPGTEQAVFNRFVTSRRDGTGLGLAIVAAIVRAHGGEVVAANAEGGGAEFTLRLFAEHQR